MPMMSIKASVSKATAGSHNWRRCSKALSCFMIITQTMLKTIANKAGTPSVLRIAMKYRAGSRLLKAPKSNRSTMPTDRRQLRPFEGGLLFGTRPDRLVVHRIKNRCHCNSHAAPGKNSFHVRGDIKVGNFCESASITLLEQRHEIGIASIYRKGEEEKNQHSNNTTIGKLAFLAADKILEGSMRWPRR